MAGLYRFPGGRDPTPACTLKGLKEFKRCVIHREIIFDQASLLSHTVRENLNTLDNNRLNRAKIPNLNPFYNNIPSVRRVFGIKQILCYTNI